MDLRRNDIVIVKKMSFSFRGLKPGMQAVVTDVNSGGVTLIVDGVEICGFSSQHLKLISRDNALFKLGDKLTRFCSDKSAYFRPGNIGEVVDIKLKNDNYYYNVKLRDGFISKGNKESNLKLVNIELKKFKVGRYYKLKNPEKNPYENHNELKVWSEDKYRKCIGRRAFYDEYRFEGIEDAWCYNNDKWDYKDFVEKGVDITSLYPTRMTIRNIGKQEINEVEKMKTPTTKAEKQALQEAIKEAHEAEVARQKVKYENALKEYKNRLQCIREHKENIKELEQLNKEINEHLKLTKEQIERL